MLPKHYWTCRQAERERVIGADCLTSSFWLAVQESGLETAASLLRLGS